MNILRIFVKGAQRMHGTQSARCLWVIPPAVDLVTISVKRRVETGGLEVFTKDVSYSTGAYLVDVLAARIARIFSNLGSISGYSHKSWKVAYNVDKLINEVGVFLKPVDRSAKSGYQVLKF